MAIGAGVLGIVAAVFGLGAMAVLVSAVVAIPLGVVLARRSMRPVLSVAAVGSAGLVVIVGAGAVTLASSGDLGPALSVPAMVLIQISVGLPVVFGSTYRAVRLLPGAAFEQLEAVQLTRRREIGLLVVEVWPRAVASVVAAFALGMMLVGSFLAADGRLEGLGDGSASGVGPVLIGLAVALGAASGLFVRRIR